MIFTFAQRKRFNSHIGELVVWVTAGIAAGGGGFIIYPNGHIKPLPPPSPLSPELPQADVAATLLLQSRGIRDPAIRAEIQRLAAALLTDSITETLESE